MEFEQLLYKLYKLCMARYNGHAQLWGEEQGENSLILNIGVLLRAEAKLSLSVRQDHAVHMIRLSMDPGQAQVDLDPT